MNTLTSAQEAVSFSTSSPELQAALIAFIVARMNLEIARANKAAA